MKHITREEIKKTIEVVLRGHKWIAPWITVHESDSYCNDYGMDSLDMVELIMCIDKEYNITIPDDAAERMDTVARTIDYLHLTLNRL